MKTMANLFLVGPMGAGKTSVGRALAHALGKPFYDSDQMLEKQLGATLSWIYDLEGLAGYRQREATLIDELTQQGPMVLSTGGDCIEVPAIRDCLVERGLVIYMAVSLETQIKRLKRDRRRPQLQGEDPVTVLIKLWEEREPLYERIADFTVATDERSVRSVRDEVLAWLRQSE